MRRKKSRASDEEDAVSSENDDSAVYKGEDDEEEEDVEEEEEVHEAPHVPHRKSSGGLPRRKSKVELTPGAQLMLEVNDRLKGLATKVCTALQRQVPVGATRSIYSIIFNLQTDIADMEKLHFPMTVTVSQEQGANDVTRGPSPLINGNNPSLAGIMKTTTLPEAKARAFIFKAVAEWFYKCWERIAANEKLGGATGRVFSAEIKVNPPIPGGLKFDLRLGEWKGSGVSFFDEEEQLARQMKKEAAASAAAAAAAAAAVAVSTATTAPQTAAAPQDKLVCSKGHPLVPLSREDMAKAESSTTTEAYEPGYTCDQCQTAYPTVGDNEVVMHCRLCSYDLCPKCAATRKSILPEAQKTAVPEQAAAQQPPQ